jgi:glycosyltransferase involved in cell wall biosynthesis
MTSPINLSIVIPAMNEEERIGESLRALQQQLPASAGPWEILVVDDGSTDRTAEVVADAASRDPRIVLRREPHRGKGGALRAGLIAARGAVRFMCDADLSMPLSELPKFSRSPSACDLAIGTREGLSRRVASPSIGTHGPGVQPRRPLSGLAASRTLSAGSSCSARRPPS